MYNLLPAHIQQDMASQLSASAAAFFYANNHHHNANNSNHQRPHLAAPSHDHHQFHHLTSGLLDEFEQFETQMLPPTPTHHFATSAGCSSFTDHLAMIQEMIALDDDDPVTCLFSVPNSADQNLNMDLDFQAFHDVSFETGIPSYAADSYDDGHTILQDIPSFGSYSVRYFICSHRNNTNTPENPKTYTRCTKRVYKGVLEAEQVTARRMELTKMRNREAAAQAHLRKQDHNAHLQTLLLDLLKKNKYLKIKLMFLQSHKRLNVHPQPLRRSISGPI